MKGLEEVLGEHAYDTGWRCSCDWTGDAFEYPAHLADVVLAWVAARLDGAREGVAGVQGVGNYCSHTGPVVNDGCEECRVLADAALAVVRDALGVPSGLRGSPVSDEERSVGFGDGSDDEGGL